MYELTLQNQRTPSNIQIYHSAAELTMPENLASHECYATVNYWPDICPNKEQ